ncbi:MAG: hypothetical protein C4583_01100 [Anaerolineaceae bacterium]|nr:MAG: hypothetical protein C4583_01100 [Anaerolineaceae bacterium]
MRWLFAGFLALALFLPQRASAQSQTAIRITAPASGDVLQDIVNIAGTSAVDGFFASELSFAYVADSTSNWFLIYQTDSPVTDGLLAAWDTTLITDGDYNLRLRVTLQDGSILESLVTGLRIRNQLPTETPAPTPTPEPIATDEFIPPATPLPPTPQPAPTSTRLPTPTPLSPNPASLTDSQIYTFLVRAIVATILTFIVVAILLRLRRP